MVSLRYKALEDSDASLFPESELALFDEQGTGCQEDLSLLGGDQPSDISDDFSDVKVNDHKQHRAGSSYDYDVVFDCEFSNGQTFELTRHDYPSNSNPGFKFKFDQGDPNKLVILK